MKGNELRGPGRVIVIGVVIGMFFWLSLPGSSGPDGKPSREMRMSLAELERMPKIDAHAHIMIPMGKGEAQFVALLKRLNLKWLDICVGGTNWAKLRQMVSLADGFHQNHPETVSWATSFNLENWVRDDWRRATVEAIRKGFDQGAVAVKVWKEIGMVLKDPDGRFVMIDDPRFAPVLDYVETCGKTLVAHIGEPRNCWLPLEAMTVEADQSYYKGHPQYHAFLHPEIPGYRDQINARDRMLEKHPGLRVVGCHLGSLEFDVDEVARRLDRYPNFAVDLAARIVHFQVQDGEKVRRFILKYQDRLLYATDNAVGSEEGKSNIQIQLAELEAVYRRDFRYFATDREIEVPLAKANFRVRGLALPIRVLKKIFYDNAVRWYPGI
jgi:predicted TIM-barrel fold metal-dependent hydrolase